MEVPKLSNIRIFREAIGWTQKELADAVGVTQSYIAKIESESQIPLYNVVKKIFDVLREEIINQHISIVGIESSTIRDIATIGDQLRVLDPNQPLSDARQLMGDFDQIPVVENEHCVGVVTSALLMLKESENANPNTPIREIMGPPLPAFSSTTSISEMRELLRYFPAAVIMEDNRVIGIVTRSDFLRNAEKQKP